MTRSSSSSSSSCPPLLLCRVGTLFSTYASTSQGLGVIGSLEDYVPTSVLDIFSFIF